jgi:ribosomal protein S27E
MSTVRTVTLSCLEKQVVCETADSKLRCDACQEVAVVQDGHERHVLPPARTEGAL